MYESLTKYIKAFENTDIGQWVVDNENDGSAEHPKHFPYVVYEKAVSDFRRDFHDFNKTHPEFDLKKYRQVLDEKGIGQEPELLASNFYANLDDKTILALITNAIRGDRFTEGYLLNSIEKGYISHWLNILKNSDLKRESETNNEI